MADHQLDQAPIAAAQDPAPAVAKEPGPGAKALQALLAAGTPSVDKVVAVLDAHRGERDDLMKLLHATLGNAFVQDVVAAMGHLRASLDRKEVVAGDPAAADGGYFLASAEEKGARWRTADGRFTGKADQKGLDSTYRLGAHDDLHATVDAKKKEGELAWDHDGKEVGALYGKQEGKGWEAGVRREDELAGGKVTTALRHQAEGGTSTDGLAVAYEGGKEGGKTKAEASLGLSEGKVVGGLEASREFEGGSKVHGQLERTAEKLHAGVDGTYALGGDRKLTGSATYDHADKGDLATLKAGYASPRASVDGSLTRHEDGHLTGGLSGTYKPDDRTTYTGALTRGDASTDFRLGASHTFSKQDSLAGSLAYRHGDDGKDQGTLSLRQDHKSQSVIQHSEFEAGVGDRSYAKGSLGLDTRLAPSFYAGAWGGVEAERGKETHATLGASLTFTPDEKSALTLAGVVNEHGALETRLQYDLFKSKLDGLAGVSQHKKDAMLSLFLSYTTKGPSGMLNDRYGAPQMQYGQPAGGDGQFTAGIRFRF